MQSIVKEILINSYENNYKAYGKLSALLIYAAAFTYVPDLTKWILSKLLQVMNERYCYIALVLITLLLMALVWNLVMMVIYKIKNPFFEQYRIYPEVLINLYRNHGHGRRITKNGYP